MEITPDKIEYISARMAECYKSINKIDDILQIVGEDSYLLPDEKLFIMFAMGRRYEHNILWKKIEYIFKYDPEETDISDEVDE